MITSETTLYNFFQDSMPVHHCHKTFSKRMFLDQHFTTHFAIKIKAESEDNKIQADFQRSLKVITGRTKTEKELLDKSSRNTTERFTNKAPLQSTSFHHAKTSFKTKDPSKSLALKNFQCDLCPDKFKTKYYIYLHMQSHLNLFACQNRSVISVRTRKVKCLKCHRIFGTVERMKLHMQNRVSCYQVDYPCKNCNFIGKTYGELRNHKSIHSKSYLEIISVLQNVKDKIF